MVSDVLGELLSGICGQDPVERRNTRQEGTRDVSQSHAEADTEQQQQYAGCDCEDQDEWHGGLL